MSSNGNIDSVQGRSELISNHWRNSFPSTRSSCYKAHYVSPVEGINATHLAWWMLLVYDWVDSKLAKFALFRALKSLYAHNIAMLVLLIWTAFCLLSLILLLLPGKVLFLIIMTLRLCVGYVAPCLLCFTLALWVGLILKFYTYQYTLKICITSCILLEFALEMIEHHGYDRNLAMVSSMLLSCGALMYTMHNNREEYLVTVVLITNSVIGRIMIVDGTMLGFDQNSFISPLSAYTGWFTGLAIALMPSISIPGSANNESAPYDAMSLSMNELAALPVMRQRRASSADFTSTLGGSVSNSGRRRRRSLPVIGFTERKVSLSTMDMTIFGEAHGMITDLLADSSLPPNVVGTLRIVADMMSPLLQHGFQRSSFSNSLVTVLEKSQVQEDEQQVMNQPDLKDDTPLSLKQRLHRNLGVSSRRTSSSYTTTTSATGMPSIDLEYRAKKISAQRSAMKSPTSRSKSYSGAVATSDVRRAFASKSHSFSLTGLSGPRGEKRKLSDDDMFKVEISHGKPVYFDGMGSGSESDEGLDDLAEDCVQEFPSGADVDPGLAGLRNLKITEGVESEVAKPSRSRAVDSDIDSIEAIEDRKNLVSFVDRMALANRLEATPRRSSCPAHVVDFVANTSLRRASYARDEIAAIRNTTESPTISEPDLAAEVPNSSEPTALVPHHDLCADGVNRQASDNDDHARKFSTVEPRLNPPLAQRPTANLNIAQVSPVPKTFSDEPKVVRSPRDSLTVPANTQRRKSSRELHLEYEAAVSEEVNLLLSDLNDWNFPIFELSEKCNILTQLAFRIFQVCGFFATFKIPELAFLKYFRALESGYHDIPYHNRIHAADVLHGVYYLTQHKIPGFHHSTSRRSSLNIDADTTQESLTDDEQDLTYGCISQAIPELELMALYTAAAMHDFDHPGRTNAFLVATLNPKALLYNDRSVLENHHAAASWSLLVSNPSMNFLSHLDSADFKRFRFIVIEEILSTDLKKHFDFMTEWNAKISEHGGGINYAIEADRLLVGQMAIKLADISGPSKVWDLHNLWTTRIVEEFYQQGDDERALDMPISPYMDRSCPKLAQLQSSFIKHLVCPLYMAYEKAGIMPGQWVDQEVSDEENGADERTAVGINRSSDMSDDSSELGEAYDGPPVHRRKRKVPFSILMDSINKNHEKWLKIIEEEEAAAAASGVISDGEVDGSTANPPATIEEEVEVEADPRIQDQQAVEPVAVARRDDKTRKNGRCELVTDVPIADDNS